MIITHVTENRPSYVRTYYYAASYIKKRACACYYDFVKVVTSVIGAL